uniref:Putative secreted protein n=1 Tax=Psorophora albipes TaxID=869069 RepID=T1E3F8_9DIPT
MSCLYLLRLFFFFALLHHTAEFPIRFCVFFLSQKLGNVCTSEITPKFESLFCHTVSSNFSTSLIQLPDCSPVCLVSESKEIPP